MGTKRKYCFAILLSLLISSTALSASAAYARDGTESSSYSAGEQPGAQLAPGQDLVTLSLYVLDANAEGRVISGVEAFVRDAAGNEFEGTTDSNGAVLFKGVPGTWRLAFARDGYRSVGLIYNVTESQVAAAFLREAEQTKGPAAEAETSASQSSADQSYADQSQGRVLQDESGMQPVTENPSVALTVDVRKDSINGAPLSGVQITGLDAAGNGFEAFTNSTGSAVISGEPGTWQFDFAKEGYAGLSLEYNVTETHEAAAYLQVADESNPSVMQSQDTGKETEPVALTVDVHKGSINGAPLSGAQITGLDAAGNGFEAFTNSTGSAVISGEPGTWQFNFAKEGYASVSLEYNVTETHEAAAYLHPSDLQSS